MIRNENRLQTMLQGKFIDRLYSHCTSKLTPETSRDIYGKKPVKLIYNMVKEKDLRQILRVSILRYIVSKGLKTLT